MRGIALMELPETSSVTDEVTWIGVTKGSFTVTAPGKMSVIHNFALDHPSADGDGLPHRTGPRSMSRPWLCAGVSRDLKHQTVRRVCHCRADLSQG